MPNSVYKFIELVGTSPESWETSIIRLCIFLTHFLCHRTTWMPASPNHYLSSLEGVYGYHDLYRLPYARSVPA